MKTQRLTYLPLRNISVAITFLVLAMMTSAHSQVTQWITASGSGFDWTGTANWTNGVPDASSYAYFSSANTPLQINVADGSVADWIFVNGFASDVTLNLATATSGTTLLLEQVSVIGHTVDPTGSSFTIGGSTGVVSAPGFTVGANGSDNGNNSLIFTDGITVVQSTVGSSTSAGRFGSNNQLRIEDGANVTLSNIDVGFDGGAANNRVTVTGAGTELTTNDSGSNRGIRIGTFNAFTGYADGMADNYIEVLDGAKMTVTTEGGSNSSYIIVGSQDNAHANYLKVSGSGSQLVLGKGSASGAGTTLSLGDSGATNLGGNYLLVENGGSVVSGAGHTGEVRIYAYDDSGTNDGPNRLTVGNNGTMQVGGPVNATNGLIQVHSSGTFSAASMILSGSSRLEAAGSNFSTTGTLLVGGGSTLAPGITGASSAESLTLNSTVTTDPNAIIEFRLFSDADNTSIILGAGGALNLDANSIVKLTLNGVYSPGNGQTWTMFTGTTTNITGDFNVSLADLPALPGSLDWDLTDFNEAGGWQISTVPEPGSLLLLLMSGAMFSLRRRRAFR